MQLLVNSLTQFNAYLDGSISKQSFSSNIHAYDKTQRAFYKDFYRVTLDEYPETFNPLIIDLLEHLQMDKAVYQGRYIGAKLTVYAFLTELKTQTNNKQLSEFIALIDEQNKKNWVMFIGVGTIFVVLGVLPFVIAGLSLASELLAMAAFIPFVSLIYTLGVAAYTLHEEYKSKDKSTFYTLFKDNFFGLISVLMNSAAYTLLLVAAATAAEVAVFFIAAKFMFVVKEVVSLVALYVYKKHAANPDSLFIQQKECRDMHDFKARRYALVINMMSALVMTAIIAGWCLIPGGVFLTVSALVALFVVNRVADYMIKSNDCDVNARLHTAFCGLEQRHAELVQDRQPQMKKHMTMRHEFEHKTQALTQKYGVGFFKAHEYKDEVLPVSLGLTASHC